MSMLGSNTSHGVQVAEQIKFTAVLPVTASERWVAGMSNDIIDRVQSLCKQLHRHAPRAQHQCDDDAHQTCHRLLQI
eukprot:6310778-Amphidinium_carterae.1